VSHPVPFPSSPVSRASVPDHGYARDLPEPFLSLAAPTGRGSRSFPVPPGVHLQPFFWVLSSESRLFRARGSCPQECLPRRSTSCSTTHIRPTQRLVDRLPGLLVLFAFKVHQPPFVPPFGTQAGFCSVRPPWGRGWGSEVSLLDPFVMVSPFFVSRSTTLATLELASSPTSQPTSRRSPLSFFLNWAPFLRAPTALTGEVCWEKVTLGDHSRSSRYRPESPFYCGRFFGKPSDPVVDSITPTLSPVKDVG